MAAHLNQVNIVSADIAASIAFYRRLGVDIPDELVWKTATGTHHASSRSEQEAGLDFEIDSATFAQVWNAGWRGRADLRGRVVVVFRMPSRESVDAVYADLTGVGRVGLQAPCDAFWGARFAIVEDPDGVAVGLMSPASSGMRSPPPHV